MPELELLQTIFYSAFEKFLIAEHDNICNDVSERNLCHRLGIYLEDERRAAGLDGYYVDAEYNRQKNGQIKTIIDENMQIVNITCDLILHSRGQNIQNDNLIAIEMKKSERPDETKQSDRVRLKALTKPTYDDVWSNDGITLPERVCGYEFGVFVEIDIRHSVATVQKFIEGQIISEQSYALV